MGPWVAWGGGLGETSVCATLSCSRIVYIDKNISSSKKKKPISPCNSRAVRALCNNAPNRTCATFHRPRRFEYYCGVLNNHRMRVAGPFPIEHLTKSLMVPGCSYCGPLVQQACYLGWPTACSFPHYRSPTATSDHNRGPPCLG